MGVLHGWTKKDQDHGIVLMMPGMLVSQLGTIVVHKLKAILCGYGVDAHIAEAQSREETSFTGFTATIPYHPRTFSDNEISIFYYFYLFVILSNK